MRSARAALIFFALFGCAPGIDADEIAILATTPPDEGVLTPGLIISVQFDRYLDPKTISAQVVKLTSGEIQLSTRVGYDAVDRRLLIKPKFSLRPGVSYTLEILRDELRGLRGERLRKSLEVSFRNEVDTANILDVSVREPTWSDVRAIFDRRCTCHGPDEYIFPPLGQRLQLNQPSIRQPEYALIQPGEPLESYVVLRLLDDYPGIYGPAKTASPAEVRTIIDWVSNLTRANQ